MFAFCGLSDATNAAPIESVLKCFVRTIAFGRVGGLLAGTEENFSVFLGGVFHWFKV